MAYFPYIWLPAFLVQAAWFGHLLVFRWLQGGAGAASVAQRTPR